MNKTVTINISGIIFHIEEDAYEKLNRYLQTIKGYFKDTEGRDEIMADIESRIAEMFNEILKDRKQVIVMADVEHVVAQMGQPEEFAGSEESPAGETQDPVSSSFTGKVKRRIYRNSEDEVVAGVCSGIAAYFDTDPLWIRLAFALMIFFGFGTGVIIYIILWVIIPEAKTAAEKLQMRGEPVNVSNIEKSIREEVEKIKSKLENLKGDLKGEARKFNSDERHSRIKNFFHQLGDMLAAVFGGIFKVVGKAIAAIMILIGVCFLTALIFTALGLAGVVSLTLPAFVDSLFSQASLSMVMITLFLVAGIPFIMLLYHGFRLLFNIKGRKYGVGHMALALWIIGIVLAIITFGNVARDFSRNGTIREKITLVNPTSDTLYLDIRNNDLINGNDTITGDVIFEDEFPDFPEGFEYALRRVKLDIAQADGNEFELYASRSARGRTRELAVRNASVISYRAEQTDSLLLFDRTFSLAENEKFRDQKVRLLLKVPVGKVIRLNHDMKKIIYDIDNITNTHDHRMTGRRWKMTEDGLSCVDCEGLEEGNHYHKTEVKISPHGKSLHLKTEVSIDRADTVEEKKKIDEGKY